MFAWAPIEARVFTVRAPPLGYHPWPACCTLLSTEKRPSNCRPHEWHLPMKGTAHWMAQWGSPIQTWSIYLMSSGNRRHPVWKYGEFQHSDLFSSVQSLSLVPLFVSPWVAAYLASLSITNSRSLLKPKPTELVRPSNHLIICPPLLLLPPIPPSIRVFSNESTLCMWWLKYWTFRFSISPSNEYPGLIPFTMDWLDLLAVQRTLNSLLQHQS